MSALLIPQQLSGSRNGFDWFRRFGSCLYVVATDVLIPSDELSPISSLANSGGASERQNLQMRLDQYSSVFVSSFASPNVFSDSFPFSSNFRISSSIDLQSIFLAQQYAEKKRKQNSRVVKVSTLYKRKADKVRPVDLSENDGSTPGGDRLWRIHAMEKQKQFLFQQRYVPHE